MRKHLYQDFNRIYILDLKGNVRKDSMREGIPIGEKHTVFGLAAMVGITVTFFVKSRHHHDHKIYYSGTDWKATRQEKFNQIESAISINGIEWKEITPDNRHTWLTEGLHAEFDTFIPMGSKEAKNTKRGETIFNLYSLGVATNRDILAYSFDLELLQEQVHTFIEIYNTAVDRKRRHNLKTPVEDFIDTTDPRIKWTRQVKASLKKLEPSTYEDTHCRAALYRPFCQKYLYFNNFWNEERYQQYRIFPTPDTDGENQVICVGGYGRKEFAVLMSRCIPDLNFYSDPQQSFPFYTYDEDGTNRQENITDWALAEFRTHYGDDTITKWDIFHYNYGLLHHPAYREKYQMNLKRDLPHIPFAEDFWGFATAGAALADLHVNYESAPKYDGLKYIETKGMALDWDVEKMRLSKDKTQLKYNDFLTLDGIPAEVYDYRLGNRSALEWVVDQYRVKTDKRSGIVNDPNRADEPRYIVDLIHRVITVSLKTVEIVKGLPSL